jgi:hypothetical protein
MFRPTRQTLAVISRRSFSTTPLRFRPSRLLAIPVLPAKSCAHSSPCSHHQLRHASSDAANLPSYIRSGDWICGKCQAHNYANRVRCFECTDSVENGSVFYKPGAWRCPTCNLPAIGNVLLDVLMIGLGNHCKRCMTTKEAEYEYPSSARDVGISLPDIF